MKICHMTSVHESLDDRIFLKEAVSAVQEGYETYIVAQGESFQKSGVKIVGIGRWDVSRLQRMIVISNKIFQKAKLIDADVYQFHDPELLPYGKKLKKLGKKVIYDSHEDVPRQIMAKEWIPLFARKIISFFYDKYEKNTAKKFDRIITATPHIEKVFADRKCTAVAVRNYPILDDIQGDNTDYFTREQKICYAGGLTKQRGITQIVRAIEDETVTLSLAGNLDRAYEEELKEEPGWKNVYLCGFLDREEICHLYKESRIGIAVLLRTPNHVNALAIKLFEYMAAGIPLICSDFPLWKDIVQGSQCGICVPPERTEEIKKAVRYLLDNPDEAKKMGDNGKKAVSEQYNWNKEKTRLLEVYKDLMREG